MLTRRGILLLLLAAPLIALATWIPSMEWVAIFYVLMCLILIGTDRRLAGSIKRFQVSRDHDSKLSLGANNPIHVSVHNLGRRTATFRLRDEPPDDFEISERMLQGECEPRQTWKERYHVLPHRRGDYDFGDLNLRWLGPLGLLERQAKVAAAGPVKVYPNLLDIRRYDLLVKQNRLQEMGLRNARLYGEGTEFERLREYTPDDEFRRIDWKATARRHRPVTTEYQTERSQNIMIVMETGRMMRSPIERIAKLDYVVNAALLLSYVATGKGDKIGLLTFADDIGGYLSPRQGRGQFNRMLEQLYAIRAEPVEPDYDKAMSFLALKQRRRALVVIFTDLTAGISLDRLVRHSAALGKRSLPLVVTISDPDIHDSAKQRPESSLDAFEKHAAEALLDERHLALQKLHRSGVLTLDVPANRLSLSVINRYLELKAKTRL
jgi:uncharacterized protein (DUF58 family)